MNFRVLRAACVGAMSMLAGVVLAYDLNLASRTITVSPQANAGATVNELRSAATYLLKRSDTGMTWTWKFSPGTYAMTEGVLMKGMQNVNLVSDPASPARLVKDPAWTSKYEYLLDFRYCRNMSMSGLQFVGLTVDFPVDGQSPNWPDQGVQFSSCNTVVVDNNGFTNFGNAALRFMTLPDDPVLGVNSINTRVTRNRFDNVFQIATTSIDFDHGGTRTYTLANNVFTRLRGSVKFATRTPGAEDIHILDNLIQGSSHYGFEINNYESVEIRGNVLRDIKRLAMNIYPGEICQTDPKTGKKACSQTFPWGSNFTIAGNVIERAGRGIEYRHPPFNNGFNNKPSNLVIEDNALSDIAPREQQDVGHFEAIKVQSSLGIDGVKVANNRFRRIANGYLVSPMPPASTGVFVANNVLLQAQPVRDLNGNLVSELVWQQAAPVSQLEQWPARTGWSAGTLTIPSGATVSTMADVDGDRRADAILKGPAAGQVSLVLSSAPSSVKRIATLDASWELAAAGDLNGDGLADLIWRRSNDATTVIWLLGKLGDEITVTRVTLNMDAAWQLIGTGDFDGDGKADLLWRLAGTTNSALWLMDGATVKSRLALLTEASSYTISASDFDADGKSEILMRNPANGNVTIVFGAATAQPQAQTVPGMDPSVWRIGAVGDFNGDGRTDIAWRSITTGRITIWSMNGSSLIGVTEVNAVDPSWRMVR